MLLGCRSLMKLLLIGINGHVSAVEPGSGHQLWTTKLEGGSFLASTNHEDVSVLLHDGVVFAGCFGHLFGLDAATGQILWHNELAGMGHNDISMAMDGVSVQFQQKVVRRND
jgi:outer membrane protein assembly factor BamB